MTHNPQIIFSQTGIGKILKDYRVKVPPHQREYRWKESHVETLFEDLHKALNHDELEYFLGTIVTIPDTDGALEVIDGQQRLATITILLSEIRRYLLGIESELANKSLTPFLSEYDSHQRTDIPKLRLNLVDNDFFGKMLRATSLPGPLPVASPISHRRIRNAFLLAEKYVKKIVAPANQKTHGDVLIRWLDFIQDNAEVILLRVPTGANAYRMFETLNDRGLKTSQADLVKSYLFSKAGDRYPEAQAAWSQMIGSLSSLQGEDDDDDKDERWDITVIFLRSALMAFHGFLRRNEVYEIVQGLARGSTTVVSLLKDLEFLAGVYEATFSQDHEKWKKYPDAMKFAIQTINAFDIKPFRPCVMSVAAKFDAKEATSAFQMFVSLGVRLLIASSTRSGSIEETMAMAAQKVFTGDVKTASDLKRTIADIIPSDEQFGSTFEVATVSKAAYARYYLRAIEGVAQTKMHPWWVPNEDRDKMTLEHVLPERPQGNWPEFTPEQVELYVKRLGNLCLLPKSLNCDLRSANQEEKKAIYIQAPYELTKQIGREKTWTVEKICERQKGLAKLALKAWPI
jgi:hypothetical protein